MKILVAWVVAPDRASRCTEDFARVIWLSVEQDWRLIPTDEVLNRLKHPKGSWIFLRGYPSRFVLLISLVGTLAHIPRIAGGCRDRKIPKVNGYPTCVRSSSSNLRRRGRNSQGRRG